MELYREFYAVINALNKNGLAYSVVGGIALAFHALPRFAREDLIRMKRSRGSKQDEADIEKLEGSE
jgi:hypothetical protein